MVVLFNKPYGVVTQFTALAGHKTLACFGLPAGVYPAGRLDADSEGLLVLTDDGALQHRLSDPRFEHPKTYWAQVEGEVSEEALSRLSKGVKLKDGMTRPCRARVIEAPRVGPRTPPIRFRKTVPTAWLELVLTEGRNRQVRRMTAAVGLPTLRLVRVRVGEWDLKGLAPGEWREASS
ncbi:MAG: pseudouridine synthase [Elusimicrobiota bacterium]